MVGEAVIPGCFICGWVTSSRSFEETQRFRPQGFKRRIHKPEDEEGTLLRNLESNWCCGHAQTHVCTHFKRQVWQWIFDFKQRAIHILHNTNSGRKSFPPVGGIADYSSYNRGFATDRQISSLLKTPVSVILSNTHEAPLTSGIKWDTQVELRVQGDMVQLATGVIWHTVNISSRLCKRAVLDGPYEEPYADSCNGSIIALCMCFAPRRKI